MINKMFSYSRRGIPLGWEGKEKGRKGRVGGCRRVGGGERKGENGIRTVEKDI